VNRTLRSGRVLAGVGVLATALLSASGLAAAAPSPAAVPVAAHHHPPAGSGPSAAQRALMRSATAGFHGLAAAEDAGYGLLHDTAGLTCIAMPGAGGMGVHWVNGPLVADPTLDPAHPQALVYAPDHDGTLRLAALEFIVDQAAWDTTHPHRPQLFRNAPFDLTTAPNRYGLPPFYSQHVWLWKPNPAGLLAMYNPHFTCR
jgi:hypothetical protein